MQAWRRVLPQHAPALTQTALAGQSRSPSHSSTVGQCTRRKSTHFLSPPTVRAQVQKSRPPHRLRRRGQRLLLTAGLPAQLWSVLLVSTAPPHRHQRPSRTGQPAHSRQKPEPCRRDGGPNVRVSVNSSKKWPVGACPREASRSFLSRLHRASLSPCLIFLLQPAA